MDRYPKRITLRDKTVVIIRPPDIEDIERLFQFFSSIPKSDLLIYKDDVSKLETIESWFTSDNYRKIFQLVTLKGDEIIAKGTLHSEGLYWQHAAEIKLIVSPDHRGNGIGSNMFDILLFEVFEHRLQKVIVRFTSDSKSFIRIIDHYGFKPETLLRYYLVDEETNEKRDLLIASYNLEDWTRRFEFYSSLFSGK
ncbi:GNAT family N-acetyltransferase [Desulfobacterota bacterium AH_259_B03_O07]|nr:GNAT family N-acetyltransferase [Desulfobacterota bacterium AH_259_B03_O07]